jgi:hypothetical protein
LHRVNGFMGKQLAALSARDVIRISPQKDIAANGESPGVYPFSGGLGRWPFMDAHVTQIAADVAFDEGTKWRVERAPRLRVSLPDRLCRRRERGNAPALRSGRCGMDWNAVEIKPAARCRRALVRERQGGTSWNGSAATDFGSGERPSGRN